MTEKGRNRTGDNWETLKSNSAVLCNISLKTSQVTKSSPERNEDGKLITVC